MRNPLNIIADSLAIISEEFDEQRHEMRHINQPVLKALGEVMLAISGLRDDLKQSQQANADRFGSHDAQIKELRKAAFSGHPAAE